MNARSFWIYTVLRILFFAVPFALLMLLPIGREFYWLSAIFAALIGLSLSVLLLRRPLEDVTTALADRRARRRARSDEDIEDAATDDADPGTEDVTTGPARPSADERPEQERAVGD